MKFYLLLLLLLSSLFAKDEVAATLHDLHLSGNIQLYMNGTDTEHTASKEDNHATSFGTILNYKQTYINNIGMELGYGGSNAIGGNENYDKTGLFNNYKPSENLNAITKGNLFYSTKKLTVKAGVQTINTPLLNEDKSHIVPWSVTALSATYLFDNNIHLHLAGITDIRSNTAAIYDNKTASGNMNANNMYMLGLRYTFEENQAFRAYLYLADELYDSFYADYKANFSLSEDFHYGFGTQYIKTFDGGENNDRVTRNGGDDVDLVGFKVYTDYHDLEFEIDYTRNFGYSGINKGYGGLTQLFTRTLDISGGDSNQARTWQFRSTYTLDPTFLGTTELAVFVLDTYHDSSLGNDYTAYYTHIHHYFNTSTSLYARYEYADYEEEDTDEHYFRIIMKYTF